MARQVLSLVRLHPDAVFPKRATRLSYGFDLATCETVNIGPLETKIIGTGWRLGNELPVVESAELGDTGPELVGGVAMLVLPRSSLMLKWGLMIPNSPGLIDGDYTGEIGVLAFNPNPIESRVIPKGTKIAQFVTCYLDTFPFVEVAEAKQTAERGGFGSTGA